MILTRSVARRSKHGAVTILASAACLAAAAFAVSPVLADSLNADALQRVVSVAPGSVGACVASTSTQKNLFSHNADFPLQPASIQKLIVTADLFETFGPESHFATELYLDKHLKGSPVIYLRGLGDPSLTTETLWLLARTVRQHGVSTIGRLVIDDSLFEGVKEREGTRAYLGGTSALAFDFDSVAITACATSPGHAAAISIDPLESGLVLEGSVQTVTRGEAAFTADEEQQNERTSLRLQGSVSASDSCVTIHHAVAAPAQIAGETFRRYLEYLGVSGATRVEHGIVPASAELLEHFQSPPLHHIAWGMNHYSTNVVAEQFLMALGGPRNRALDSIPLGSTLNRDAALQSENNFARTLLPRAKDMHIVDGSGLSHENRVPAQLFCDLLVRMDSQPNVSIEFGDALSVSGRSGTLTTRTFDLPTGAIRAKTGTIDGVSALAGYLVSKRGTKYAFTIIQNSSLKKGDAVQIENRFVRALYNDGGS